MFSHRTIPNNKQTNLQKANLLTIPAELRNTIYENVLLSKKRIDLSTKPNRRPPGLLSTCCHIRKEALPIYYKGNSFKFTVHEYDGTEAKHAFGAVQKYRPDDKKAIRIVLCENCNSVDIDSLNQWLQEYHADAGVPGLRQDKSADEHDEQTLARRTFGVVKAMRKKSWEEVEEVLGAFYRAIEAFQITDGGDDEDEDEDEDDWSDEDDEYDDADGFMNSDGEWEGRMYDDRPGGPKM